MGEGFAFAYSVHPPTPAHPLDQSSQIAAALHQPPHPASPTTIRCLWSCTALHGDVARGTPPPCPNPACRSGLCVERLEAVALPKWLLVQLRRDPGKAHFSVPQLALTEARLGPDLDGCASLELPEAGGQLASFDL